MATLSICDPLHSPRYGTPLPMTSFLISSISSASLALSISMSPGCLFSSSSFLSDGMLTSLPYGLYSAPRSFPSTTRTPSMPGQDIIIPLLVISSLLTANQVGFELLGSCQGSGNEDGNSSIPLKQIDVVLPDKVNLQGHSEQDRKQLRQVEGQGESLDVIEHKGKRAGSRRRGRIWGTSRRQGRRAIATAPACSSADASCSRSRSSAKVAVHAPTLSLSSASIQVLSRFARP
mmetsp:Transcript_2889/g.9739  ORF Transcript_2889/g.9739 Transcript_2889/m.9739 type:complete len:233 (+) Transcript_2889:698-1396(+)